MALEIVGGILLLVGFFVAFIAARFLRKLYRTRQLQKAEQAARVGESRQVRRARERAERK